jgi:hypothetical protein
MSVVRPEYGPTLPELVGPRWRALPRAVRIVLAVLGVAVVAVLVVQQRGGDRPLKDVVVREPVAFNLGYPSEILRRVAPRAPDVLALREVAGREPMRVTVRPFKLAAYKGDSSAALLGLSSTLILRMEAADPNWVLRGEGRARTNDAPGYSINFQTKLEGRTAYGKRYLLVPAVDPEDPNAVQPREGIDLTLISARSPAVQKVDDIGANGGLKSPLRSFRFGTDRP